jgi:acyl-coenzyme A synthetase/AMP-(fatty) acid ligase
MSPAGPSPAVPLLGASAPDEIVAWDEGSPINAHAFLSAARRLAARFPVGGSALLLCDNRVRFALALCACAVSGVEVLLPPVRTGTAIGAVVDRRDPAFALVDRPGAFGSLPAIAVDDGFVAEEAFAVPVVPADRVVATLYTSGTTGVPAAHRKTWGSLVRGAGALAERLGFVRGSAVVGAVPPQHMWGFEATVMLPLVAGGVLHAALPLLPRDVAECLRDVPAPRWLVLTPIHVHTCLKSRIVFPPLAGALCATAPLDADDARAFEQRTNAPLIEIYGATETGAVGTRRAACERAFRPLDKLAAVASATGTTFRGGHLDGEVRLNDRIRVVGSGHFELAGRDADLVKIGGKRASLADIALALKRIPGVLDAACVLDERGERLVSRLVGLVVAPGLDAPAIRGALRGHVDPVFLPRRLHVVQALPRDAVGKLRGDDLAIMLRRLDGRELEGEAPA